MNKKEFLGRLRRGLSGLPQKDIEERINFYSEIIDDRMEEGLLEEEAVSGVGSVEEIIFQIRGEVPGSQNETKSPKREGKALLILLLVLGFPLWFPLLITVFLAALSVYISLWAVIISLWAAFASAAVCSVSGLLMGGVLAFAGHVPTGVAMMGAAMVCAGVSILLFLGCLAVTRGTVWLTGKLALGIKNCFAKKEVSA